MENSSRSLLSISTCLRPFQGQCLSFKQQWESRDQIKMIVYCNPNVVYCNQIVIMSCGSIHYNLLYVMLFHPELIIHCFYDIIVRSEREEFSMCLYWRHNRLWSNMSWILTVAYTLTLSLYQVVTGHGGCLY